ncbi:MAG: Superfamily helicase protein [Herbinix sp.]|nr:Superfamily helicase protein [Herbinix sp.]
MRTLQEINSLTAESILSEDVLCEVMEEADEVFRARLLLTLIDRAQELGVKGKFEILVKAYTKAKKKYEKEHKQEVSASTTLDRTTEFDSDFGEMRCGNWIANDNGIRTFGPFGGEILACYHPIIPVQRLINAETGREKIKLAYKKGNRWKDIIIDKGMIASANRIVGLADYGISVTSESAKNLVRYLSDIENYNMERIEVQVSTGKLGWIEKEFMPYGKGIIFDNETRFKDTYESIHEQGSCDTWMSIVKQIRKSERFEPKIYIAGALASVLVEPLNALPFVLNLWGDAGKGKTVAIMLAASVWANPWGNDYVTDPKSTMTALELRMDFLNNLPMLIDDMAQLKNKYDGDFSELVYMLCSGKGKDRANVTLGLNKSTTWRNVILTNGEHSLVTETMQGGAINRIIDVRMEDGYIFENGNHIVEAIKTNYGFAGRMFIDAIEQIGIDQIRQIQQGYLKQINDRALELGVEKEEKQSLPMSVLLTADKIATDYIFEDGIYMDFNTCVDLLKNKGEVSENERAYEFILSEAAINMNKFKPDSMTGEYRGEVWGAIEGGYLLIINNAFNKICERGNFSSKSFLAWATRQGLIDTQSGKNTKTKRINGSVSRCVYLKLPTETSSENMQIEIPEEFMKVPEDKENDIPFN